MDELKGLIGTLIGWPALLGLVVAYSLIPGVLLQVVARIYPRDHARRRELLAEYKAAVPMWKRPVWVSDVAVAAVFEGLDLRKQQYERRYADRLAVQMELLNTRSGQLDNLHHDLLANFDQVIITKKVGPETVGRTKVTVTELEAMLGELTTIAERAVGEMQRYALWHGRLGAKIYVIYIVIRDQRLIRACRRAPSRLAAVGRRPTRRP